MIAAFRMLRVYRILRALVNGQEMRSQTAFWTKIDGTDYMVSVMIERWDRVMTSPHNVVQRGSVEVEDQPSLPSPSKRPGGR